MKTKEAIEKVEKLNEILYEETISDIVSVLKRGEKFEKMWEELENKDITYKSDSPVINDEMYYIKQKYFPKED